MNTHWRYKCLYWNYETRRYELRLKKEPVKNYCHTRGCSLATPLRRLASGKLVPEKHCAKCKRRRWRVNNPYHHLYAELRRSAKRRGIYFDLHHGEFIAFCLENNLYRDSNKFTKDSLTVDRINPDLGYTIGNIQIITQHENTAKGNAERAKRVKASPTYPTSDDPF